MHPDSAALICQACQKSVRQASPVLLIVFCMSPFSSLILFFIICHDHDALTVDSTVQLMRFFMPSFFSFEIHLQLVIILPYPHPRHVCPYLVHPQAFFILFIFFLVSGRLPACMIHDLKASIPCPHTIHCHQDRRFVPHLPPAPSSTRSSSRFTFPPTMSVSRQRTCCSS